MEKQAQPPLQVQKSHCIHCFQTLYAHLSKSAIPMYPSFLPDVKCPLFVTWHKGKSKDLRGCIGTFDGNCLISQLLPKYTLYSAIKDSRFPPITLEEFQELTVCVSFLINFENAENVWDWKVGKHGISIEFEYPDANQNNKIIQYSGTYLPEIAMEQNWSQEEAIESLVKKAGFFGKAENVLKSMKLERYESSRMEMSFKEFIDEISLLQKQEV